MSILVCNVHLLYGWILEFATTFHVSFTCLESMCAVKIILRHHVFDTQPFLEVCFRSCNLCPSLIWDIDVTQRYMSTVELSRRVKKKLFYSVTILWMLYRKKGNHWFSRVPAVFFNSACNPTIQSHELRCTVRISVATWLCTGLAKESVVSN